MHFVEDDFKVQTNEGFSDDDVNTVKKILVMRFGENQKELCDISSIMINTMQHAFGGKWCSNIRACSLENGNSF